MTTETLPPLSTDLFGSHVGTGWSTNATTVGSRWEDLSATTQQLFLGVAEGWWEDVDIKRGMPIPFPKVFNIKKAKPHWTMAHVLAELKAFPSVSEARKNGWNKPITTGEFWLFRRTLRVIIFWLDEEPDDDN